MKFLAVINKYIIVCVTTIATSQLWLSHIYMVSCKHMAIGSFTSFCIINTVNIP